MRALEHERQLPLAPEGLLQGAWADGASPAAGLAVLADWLLEHANPRCRERGAALTAALRDRQLIPLGLARVPGQAWTTARFAFGPFAERIGAESADAQLVLLPPIDHDGGVWVGSPDLEAWRNPAREARNFVRLGALLLARTAISQRLYDGEHEPFHEPSPLHPANRLSWLDASAWCRALGLRLPYEVEWEFACRGGTQSAFHFGELADPRLANYRRPGQRGGAVDVASLPANGFGLHEMHGNAGEWVADSYHHDSRGEGGRGLEDSALRVVRGGAWSEPPQCCRAAYRRAEHPGRRSISLGVRVARALDPVGD